MPDIILTTLNARFAHAAFGLRYLLANLPAALRERTELLEFDINQRSLEVLEVLLAREPRIVGIGVYIWNAEQSLKLVADLKRIRPDILVILGGPEVSYETEQQPISALADYVITGEADIAFGELCMELLGVPINPGSTEGAGLIRAATVRQRRASEGIRVAGQPLPDSRGSEKTVRSQKIIAAPLPQFSQLALPYELYDDRDIAHRVIYVEASRGCPFKCEFCLSSLDIPVRNAPLETFLSAMGRLLARGVRHFKFVDRTFNLNLQISTAILDFFYERYTPGLFLHFEMIPDRLPEALREPIRRFPAGALQFEVGIQTFNPAVSQRISRRQDNAKVAENLRFLREETGVHVHADLIVGLPGEDLSSFAEGFDRLVAMGPQEIQVGILKRLRGTNIIRHDGEFQMRYSPHPPYEILQNSTIDFVSMQRMRRFARYWDLVANSGNFVETTPLLWQNASPFMAFTDFSEQLYRKVGRQHSIALPALAGEMFQSLLNRGHDAATIAPVMARDYQRGGRADVPEFLRPWIAPPARDARARMLAKAPRRQARHLAGPD